MMFLSRSPRISISWEREEVPVATMHPTQVPDPDWRFIDKAGHGHFWKKDKLPTLKWVVTGKTWVGDEYDGYEIELGEYQCKNCGEAVEPKKRSEYGPTSIPGLTTFTIAIDDETFVVPEEIYVKSIAAWRDSLRKLS
jgi:hypothetical protein